MRREKTLLSIKQIKPHGWKLCDECNNEFKKEIGYRIRNVEYNWVKISYICSECAKTEEEALNIYNKGMDFDEYNPPSASSSITKN